VLRHLSFITPNANELLAIAAAVQQHERASSSRASSRANHSHPLQPSALEQACSPQQLLAQLVPAATTVLSQGELGCLRKQVAPGHHTRSMNVLAFKTCIDKLLLCGASFQFGSAACSVLQHPALVLFFDASSCIKRW
jgi:hypothetical protein